MITTWHVTMFNLHGSVRATATREEQHPLHAVQTVAEVPCLMVQVEDLLREAMILQTSLERVVPASILERLLPKRFKQYQKGISSRA